MSESIREDSSDRLQPRQHVDRTWWLGDEPMLTVAQAAELWGVGSVHFSKLWRRALEAKAQGKTGPEIRMAFAVIYPKHDEGRGLRRWKLFYRREIELALRPDGDPDQLRLF